MNRISSGVSNVRSKVEKAGSYVEATGTRAWTMQKLTEARNMFPGLQIELSIVTLIIAAVCIGVMVLRFKVFGSF